MTDPSSVSSHLGIPLAEYDARIRTFVPYYEEMLTVASESFALKAPHPSRLLELGIGSGALAARCRRLRPDVEVIGIDADAAILEMARARLGTDHVELRTGNFTSEALPDCDVIVASLSLHHVRNFAEKAELYRRCRRSTIKGGFMIIADCFLPDGPEHVSAGKQAWRAFLELEYPPAEADKLLSAWSNEDTYFPLRDELAALSEAGFQPDVIWRRGMFAVLVCV